jgi:hypothetical protein
LQQLLQGGGVEQQGTGGFLHGLHGEKRIQFMKKTNNK